MDAQSVIEFLGRVLLLQRLPSSSLRRIADVVIVIQYGPGEKVIGEGESGSGIYFIWEGVANVSGTNHAEFQLEKYDYFGNSPSTLQAQVIALSNLTCLVLPHEHANLLKNKSIWSSADEASEKCPCPLVENILRLDPIGVNVFQGITLTDAIISSGMVFGGQFIGQALAAASQTVDCLKIVHSLHAYFLVAGNVDMPIIYEVYPVRDGISFATRRVEAKQKGIMVFSLLVSFQKEESIGFDYQEALTLPLVPEPKMLLSAEERRATKLVKPWPIEIRFCEPNNSTTNQTMSPPSSKFWFRARGKLSDDQALHRCVVAYASDLIFLGVSLINPHRDSGSKTTSVSLDHSIWFHRPVRADDWLLFVTQITSPVAARNARGFVSGQMYTRDGNLAVSLAQEGFIRKPKIQGTLINPKM